MGNLWIGLFEFGLLGDVCKLLLGERERERELGVV